MSLGAEKEPVPDLKSQGVHALFWDLLGKLGGHGIGFLFTIFLARLLDPSDFGLIAMVMVYVGVAAIFTDAGLAGALVQRKNVGQIHYSSVFYFNLLAALSLAGLTYFSASSIALFYQNQDLLPIAQIMSASFVINALCSVQSVKLRKDLNYSALTKAGLCASLLGGIVGIVLALNGFGVYSLVAQSISTSAIRAVMIWLTCRWSPSAQFSYAALKQLWVYGFRMFLVSLMNAVSIRLDVLVIGKLFPAATLGYFDLAKRFSMLVNQYSSGSLMSVMFPVLSKIQSEHDRFKKTVCKTLDILSMLVFLIVGLLYLSSEHLIVFLYSEKWSPSVVYLKLLLLSGFAYPLNALLVNVLTSKGNSKAFLRMAIIKKIFFFLNIANFFIWGIEGYLIGLVFVGVINTSITIVYASREMDIRYAVLAKPIAYQACIFAFSLIFVLELRGVLSISFFANFATECLMFLFLFLTQNWLLKTESWRSVKDQVWPNPQ